MKLIDADALLKKTINNPLHVPYITKKDVIDMPSALNNQVNLCDSCTYTYPECPSEKDDVIFGNGIGNDNICACNKYQPTVQPVATDINVGDTISRQQAIDAINHICPVDTEYDCTLLDRVDVRCVLSDLPTIQPVATDINVGDTIPKFIDGLEEIFADLRERHVDDSVCGLCEYDGAYIGQSGDWCNECPGFERDDCFKLSDKTRKEWTEEIIKALPTIQPEERTEKRMETHACDLISRQVLCEYALNQKDKSVTPNDIMRFPSAQSEPHWIPLEEKMPDTNVDILLQFESNMTVGFYEDGDWAINTGDGIYSMIGDNEEKPIAWMPLPEAYKEGGERI